jgi:hypothetical protein
MMVANARRHPPAEVRQLQRDQTGMAKETEIGPVTRRRYSDRVNTQAVGYRGRYNFQVA